MVFASIKFLLFLVIFFTGYFVFPKKYRWVFLLCASVYFYLCTGIKNLLYLLFSVAFSYLFGLYCRNISSKYEAFEKTGPEKEAKKAYMKRCDGKKKVALTLVIAADLAILAVLKYAGFAISNISTLVGAFSPGFELSVPSFVVPLGISFYSFMSIGYCVDVYRGVSEPEKNPFKLALFLGYFPHIMQGPIDRYEDLSVTLFEGHEFDYKRMTHGLYRIIFGFFEKLVIADRLALLVDQAFSVFDRASGLYLCIAVFLYAVQIYADFAGYMDIVLGASAVVGVYPAENFDAPYFSESIPEFWRRWHMTLGSWFRDYLFYPILRSAAIKKLSKRMSAKTGKTVAGSICACIALGVVWFATGLWHGAAWHYIAWGVYYGVLMMLSTVTKPLTERLSVKLGINRECGAFRFYSRIKTFLLVLVGYILFRADNTKTAVLIIRRMITAFALPDLTPGFVCAIDAKDLAVAFFGIVILFVADIMKYRKIDVCERFEKLPMIVRWVIVYLAVGSVILFGVYGPEYDSSSFIYFQF